MPEIIAEGKHIRLVRSNNWEYIERVHSNGVVEVLPITTDGELILVEQYRTPIACSMIELPAGISGDITGAEDEQLEEAARRELLEETGYQADRLYKVYYGPSSAGITNEKLTFFIAPNVTKISDDVEEQITVHCVPMNHINSWLSAQECAGKMVSMRIYAGLYILGRRSVDKAKELKCGYQGCDKSATLTTRIETSTGPTFDCFCLDHLHVAVEFVKRVMVATNRERN